MPGQKLKDENKKLQTENKNLIMENKTLKNYLARLEKKMDELKEDIRHDTYCWRCENYSN